MPHGNHYRRAVAQRGPAEAFTHWKAPPLHSVGAGRHNFALKRQHRRTLDPSTVPGKDASQAAAILPANTACNYRLVGSCSGYHTNVARVIEQETMGT
jgi:hypothetical protein